jgi:hypothetical protein
MKTLLRAGTAVTLAAVALSFAPAAARAQTATAASGNVTLKLTIPDGVTRVKSVFAFTVRGLASGWAAGAGFKDLIKRLDSALVMVSGGDDLNDNSYPGRCASGEFNGIPDALTKLGEMTSHPELAHAPIVGIGHSHGGDYWNWFNACHPDRMALVFVHASGGVNYSAAALRTPVLYELGTGDLVERGSKKPRAGMFANRAKGAPMSLVIGQGEGHDQVGAGSLQMMIDLIEATWKMRVPADADPSKGPVQLYEIDEAKAGSWLGDLYTKEITPYASFTGNKALTAFLPNEEVAKKWKMTGPALPMNIMLPTGACSWCGTPKDEPKAGAPGPTAPPSPGAPTPPPAPPPAVTPPAPTPDPVTPPAANPPPAPTGKPPVVPDPTAGAPAAPAGDSVSGGCSLGGRPGSAGVLGLMFAALLVIRRRRL